MEGVVAVNLDDHDNNLAGGGKFNCNASTISTIATLLQ